MTMDKMTIDEMSRQNDETNGCKSDNGQTNFKQNGCRQKYGSKVLQQARNTS